MDAGGLEGRNLEMVTDDVHKVGTEDTQYGNVQMFRAAHQLRP